MNRLILAFLTTACVAGFISGVGLALAPDYSPGTLTDIFLMTYFPSIIAGLIVYAIASKRARRVSKAPNAP